MKNHSTARRSYSQKPQCSSPLTLLSLLALRQTSSPCGAGNEAIVGMVSIGRAKFKMKSCWFELQSILHPSRGSLALIRALCTGESEG